MLTLAFETSCNLIWYQIRVLSLNAYFTVYLVSVKFFMCWASLIKGKFEPTCEGKS